MEHFAITGSANRTTRAESSCYGAGTHASRRDTPWATRTRTQREEMLLLRGGVASSEELSSPPKIQRLPVGTGRLVGAKVTSRPQGRIMVLVSFNLPGNLTGHALIDSAAEGNFIDSRFWRQSGLANEPLGDCLSATAPDGHLLKRITHRTVPVEMIVSGNHRERISFLLIDSLHSPIILGLPWLQVHNPQIDWQGERILGWSVECHALCLKSAESTAPMGGTEVETVPDLTSIPREYHDLRLVFSKDQTISLPPHRPYDCSIELLPGARFSSSSLYSLSQMEREAMET